MSAPRRQRGQGQPPAAHAAAAAPPAPTRSPSGSRGERGHGRIPREAPAPSPAGDGDGGTPGSLPPRAGAPERGRARAARSPSPPHAERQGDAGLPRRGGAPPPEGLEAVREGCRRAALPARRGPRGVPLCRAGAGSAGEAQAGSPRPEQASVPAAGPARFRRSPGGAGLRLPPAAALRGAGPARRHRRRRLRPPRSLPARGPDAALRPAPRAAANRRRRRPQPRAQRGQWGRGEAGGGADPSAVPRPCAVGSGPGVCVCVCLSVCLSVRLPACLPASLPPPRSDPAPGRRRNRVREGPQGRPRRLEARGTPPAPGDG